jgi:transcriptional regulator with XRE-family HTH domain
MTISERIFLRLDEIGMSQKDFSERTGIAQSTISEWKTKKNNPTADKIMIICDVLDVTPYWLLSGTEQKGDRGKKYEYYIIGKESELGHMVTEYNGLKQRQRDRIIGYYMAYIEMLKKDNK